MPECGGQKGSSSQAADRGQLRSVNKPGGPLSLSPRTVPAPGSPRWTRGCRQSRACDELSRKAATRRLGNLGPARSHQAAANPRGACGAAPPALARLPGGRSSSSPSDARRPAAAAAAAAAATPARPAATSRARPLSASLGAAAHPAAAASAFPPQSGHVLRGPARGSQRPEGRRGGAEAGAAARGQGRSGQGTASGAEDSEWRRSGP